MGAVCGKIKSNFEADNFFSYKTVKLVVIKDKRLGIIHYILQLIIFVYIVIYTILYQQRYLLLEAPYGSIRSTVREPPIWPDVNTLPYCTQNQATYNNFLNQNCTYMMGTDLMYPPAQENTIMVATRFKDTIYSTPDGCDPEYPTSLNCVPQKSSASAARFYTAAVESFSIYMEHAIFGRQNKLVKSNAQCEGKLLFKDDKAPVTFTDPGRGGDVMPFSTILEAAGVSLDEASGLDNTFRYDGMLLVAVVTYSNDVYDSSRLRYEYQLFNIPLIDVVAMQPSHADGGNTTVQRNWYGVRLIFMVVGAIGYFDFPTLLTSLVNGTVLIKTASVIVDMLILYIMPDKKYYSKHKFETTDAFGKMKAKSTTQLSDPLIANDYAADQP